MPLVRKPTAIAPVAAPDAADMLRALQSADPDERWGAARAASAVIGAAAAMAAALRVETEAHVREALFTSLGRAGTPESTEELICLVRSDQSALRTGALDALQARGDAIRDILPRLLADTDADVRILSCELARALPGDEATALLRGLLTSEPDVNVCAAAVDVLAELGTPAAVPGLQRCAARFGDDSFLGFAIQVATDRIASQSRLDRD